jgi:hypothetical protein
VSLEEEVDYKDSAVFRGIKAANEKFRLEDVERGYNRVELNKTKERLISDRRDWVRKFDDYIEQLIKDGTYGKEAVRIAAEIADLRQDKIDEKFPEVLED